MNSTWGVGGPMARSAEDLRLFWSALSGNASAQKGIGGLRVGVWHEDENFPLARDVKDGVNRAAVALEQQGAVVMQVRSPLDTRDLLLTYRRILAPIRAAGFPDSMLAQMEMAREADKLAVGQDPDPWDPAFNRLECTSRYYEFAGALR